MRRSRARSTPRRVSRERWEFALTSQERHQRSKPAHSADGRAAIERHALASSTAIASLLETHGHPPGRGLVVEVGAGSHGLIWRWPASNRIAIDPLADFYRERFAFLQRPGPRVVPGRGEELPLETGSVDILLSDNVLDHVQDPARFLSECRRVLAPTGVAYISVDVHHRVWGAASRVYNRLFDAGLRLRMRAFPSHPFHFTAADIDALLSATRLDVRWRRDGRPVRGRLTSPEAAVKRVFFKNARIEMLCAPRPDSR